PAPLVGTRACARATPASAVYTQAIITTTRMNDGSPRRTRLPLNGPLVRMRGGRGRLAPQLHEPIDLGERVVLRHGVRLDEADEFPLGLLRNRLRRLVENRQQTRARRDGPKVLANSARIAV